MGTEKGNSNSDDKDTKKLSFTQKFTYIIAVLPQTILAGLFSLNYVNFFWDNLKLQQNYFVIGQLIYMFVNAFNDFFLGRLSDQTNVKRWGSRRLIYIKWGGPAWALVFFLMWFPWSYTNQIIIFIHFLVSICAFDMFLTLVILVWMALLPELTENLAERNQIQFYNQIFVIIGALPVLISLSIFESSLQAFQLFAGIMAIISAILYFIVGSKLRERPELYINEDIPGLWKSIKETLKSRSFISYTSYKFFNYVNNAMLLPFVFAYMYIVGVDVFMTSILFYVIYTLFGWLGYGLYMQLSKKHEMQTLIIRGRIIHIIISIIGFIVILQPGMELAIWLFMGIQTIVSGYLLFAYPYLMLATDEDEVLHGFRREGLFLGTNAFFIKFSDSVGPIIATSVLLFFGFVRDAPVQSAQAILGIKVLFFIIPTIMNILGLICISFYPLKGEYLKEIRSKLLELHEQKAQVHTKLTE
ncbi:MAG: MFS transporter [Promethearchaeota archaeon]